MKLYMFRTVRLSIIRSLFTVHLAMVYVIQVCRQLSSRSICFCNNFTNLFWHETLHVSGSSSVHHQEFIHCTLSNGMSYSFVDSFRAVAYASAIISQIYFGMKLYMFRAVPPSIIRSLFVVHSVMVYVIQVCRQLSSRSICSCSTAVEFHAKINL